MMKVMLCCALMLLSLQNQKYANGEEGILGQQPKFSAVIAEALESRSQLVAGEFEYTMTHKRLKDELVGSVQRGIYAYDDRVGTSLHVYIRAARDQDGHPGIHTIIGGGVFIPPPEPSLTINGVDSMLYRPVEPDRRRKVPFRPFDFRCLGYAFIGDFIGNEDFETVLTNHLSHLDKHDTLVKLDNITSDPDLRKKLGDTVSYERGGVLYSAAINRDFWVLRQRHEVEGYRKNKDGTLSKSTSRLMTGSDIELVEFEHRHLPAVVDVMNSNQAYKIRLDWRSINEPIDHVAISDDRAMEIVQQYRQLKLDPKLLSLLDTKGD